MLDLCVLVNRDNPLSEEIGAEDLCPCDPRAPKILLDRRAADALQALFSHIGAGDEIIPVSGYRSREEQTQIFKDSIRENGEEFTLKYVALPGCSEHQTGLAIDLGKNGPEIDFICPDFPYEGVCKDFLDCAHQFGFILRYPAGKEAVTGIAHEPWHFRYVGPAAAAEITENGLVLEEYKK